MGAGPGPGGTKGWGSGPLSPCSACSGALGPLPALQSLGDRSGLSPKEGTGGPGRGGQSTPHSTPHPGGPLWRPCLLGHGQGQVSRAPTVNTRRFRLKGGIISSVETPMTLGSTEVLLETPGPPRTFPLSLWEPRALNKLLGGGGQTQLALSFFSKRICRGKICGAQNQAFMDTGLRGSPGSRQPALGTSLGSSPAAVDVSALNLFMAEKYAMGCVLVWVLQGNQAGETSLQHGRRFMVTDWPTRGCL